MKNWHRPLLALAVTMVALSVVCVVGLLVDPRTITGMPLWAKPLKFSLSVVIYSITLAWLLGLLSRGKRLGWWLGTVTAIFLAVEMVIIVGAAALGVTSHFNVSSALNAALWGVMGVSISIVWGATIIVAVLLFRARLGDPARTFAIRSAVVLAIVGMGLAFLMTGPQGDQISNYTGVIGAHTVGLADGGPGVPILGWSTVAGDLRIPHFIGMHALQIIPLIAIGLETLTRRSRTLSSATVRRSILRIVVAVYVAVLAILTAQALAGQSIARPDATITTITLVLAAAAVLGVALVLLRARHAAAAAAPAAAPLAAPLLAAPLAAPLAPPLAPPLANQDGSAQPANSATVSAVRAKRS